MTGERDFITALRALVTHPAARGLADDAAVLPIGGETLVVTQDTLVAGVHVHADQDPADIAWKLVAVNLSDLAAKGARPVGVLVSHMLGEGDDRFLAGLGEVLTEYDVPLLGGDTVRGDGQRAWTCTALGTATHVPVPNRRGARPGDAVFVTGLLGRAMLGFEAPGADVGNDLAYRRPTPRLAEGRVLAPLVTAMMDVSDGLLLDCRRLAEASGVSIRLDSAAIPVADRARLTECVTWGDDYELLFTLPPESAPPVPANRIGEVTARGGSLLYLDGRPQDDEARLGYLH